MLPLLARGLRGAARGAGGPRGLPRRAWAALATGPAEGARQLPDGWVALHSPEHGREYFWHRPSGTTTWDPPPPAAAAANAAVTASADGRLAAATAASAAAAPAATAAAAADGRAGAAAPAAAAQAGGAAALRVRAREFPDGWCAVHSDAHGREYYWHRLSGATSWDPPPLPAGAAGAAGLEAAGDSVVPLAPEEWFDVKKAVQAMLREYSSGEELRQADFELARRLLKSHPDSAAKIGCGVRAIKVDASLHESDSRCFWVLRHDGSAEDFSFRKCLEALRAGGQL